MFINYFFWKNILFKEYEKFNKIYPKLFIDFNDIVEILETISIESSILFKDIDYQQIEYISLYKNRTLGNSIYSSKNLEQANTNANMGRSESGNILDTENDGYLQIV